MIPKFWSLLPILLLLLLYLFISPIHSSPSSCLQYESCFNCTQTTECVWCSKEATCKPLNSTCSSAEVFYLFNELFHGKLNSSVSDYKKIRTQEEYHNYYYIRDPKFQEFFKQLYDWPDPSSFDSNFESIYNTSQCPVFELHPLNDDYKQALHLTQPMPLQPLFSILPSEAAIHQNYTWNDTFIDYQTCILGTYFLKQPNDIAFKPRFYSMNSNTFRDTLFLGGLFIPSFGAVYNKFDKQNQAMFLDLAVAAPFGDYQIGYAIAIQVAPNQFQVSYVPSKFPLKVTEHFSQPFGVVFWVVLGIFCFGLIVQFFFLWCCLFEKEHTSNLLLIEKEPQRVYWKSLEKAKPLEMIVSIFCLNNRTILKKAGAQAYFFFHFQHLLLLCSFLIMIVAAVALPVDAVFSKQLSVYPDMSMFTIAGIPSTSDAMWTHVVISIVLIGIIYGFIAAVIYLSRLVVFKSYEKTARIHTLRISNLPKELINKEDIESIFVKKYGKEQILAVHIAYELSNLTPHLKRREKYESNRIVESSKKKPNQQKLNKWDAYIEYENHIILQFKNNPVVKGTGHAYITFRSEVVAKQCLRDMKLTSLKREMGIEKWKFAHAKDPHDIQWDHLGYSVFSRVLRNLCSHALLLLLFALLSVIIIVLNFFGSIQSFLREVLNKYLEVFVAPDATLYYITLSTIFETLPLVLVFILIIIFPAASAITKMEKHQHISGEIRSFFRIHSFYLFFIGLVLNKLPMIILGQHVAYNSEPPFDTIQFLMTRLCDDMTSTFIFLFLLVKSLEIYLVILLPMIISFFKKRCVTRPEFQFRFGYPVKVMYLVIAFYFAPLLPFMPMLAFAFFVITYILDKWTILYFFKKPKVETEDGSILKEVAMILAVYVILFPIYFSLILIKIVKENMSLWIFLIMAIPLAMIGFGIVIYLYWSSKPIIMKHLIDEDSLSIIEATNRDVVSRKNSRYNSRSPSADPILKDYYEDSELQDAGLKYFSDSLEKSFKEDFFGSIANAYRHPNEHYFL